MIHERRLPLPPVAAQVIAREVAGAGGYFKPVAHASGFATALLRCSGSCARRRSGRPSCRTQQTPCPTPRRSPASPSSSSATSPCARPLRPDRLPRARRPRAARLGGRPRPRRVERDRPSARPARAPGRAHAPRLPAARDRDRRRPGARGAARVARGPRRDGRAVRDRAERARRARPPPDQALHARRARACRRLSPPAVRPDAPREVVEAARACMDWAREGIPFHEMAVAYRNDEPYRALVESIFDGAEIPIYLHDGTPLAERPLGRARSRCST